MNQEFKIYIAGVIVLFIMSLIVYFIFNLIPGVDISLLEGWGIVMILLSVKLGWDNYHGIDSEDE
jgi:hypothetical protein